MKRLLSTVALVCAAALVSAELAAASGNGPEISRSRGKSGGAVVLWPRVVPETDDPRMKEIARKLQAKLGGIAERTVSDRKTSLRPAPERVCPQSGCKAVSLGVMLGHQEGGCAAIAIVGSPGAEAATLVPWGGLVDMRSRVLSFRQPPETLVTVTEFIPCGELLTSLDDGPVELAISNVTPGAL